MIRINLLPHRQARRKAVRQQFYVLSGLIAVLAGLIWFVGYGYIAGLIEAQASKNQFLKSEIAALDQQIQEIRKLKEQTEIMLARKQVIESLQANRSETVHLFNELVGSLPSGVYLRSIKQDSQKISLVGLSQSNARVSSLMQNLDASPVLERPLLVEIKATKVGKQSINEFSLDVFLTRATTETAVGGKQAGQSKGKQ